MPDQIPDLVIRQESTRIPQPEIDQRKIHKEFSDSTGRPCIVLKYFQDDECFSKWQPRELKKFTAFNEKLKKTTWKDIQANAELGYKKIPTIHIPKIPRYKAIIQEISPDLLNASGLIQFSIGKKARVFGTKFDCGFFLLLLDRNHKVLKS